MTNIQLPKVAENCTINVNLPANRPAMTHRGYAFITYSAAEDAEDAIDNMHMNVLCGVCIYHAHTDHRKCSRSIWLKRRRFFRLKLIVLFGKLMDVYGSFLTCRSGYSTRLPRRTCRRVRHRQRLNRTTHSHKLEVSVLQAVNVIILKVCQSLGIIDTSACAMRKHLLPPWEQEPVNNKLKPRRKCAR